MTKYDKASLSLHSLAVGYRRHTVAAGINASAAHGELTCLIGVNGAGKSTLLRTMAGLQQPLQGLISLQGDNLTQIAPHELTRRLAIVLTGRISAANLTVRQLVGLGRSPYTGFWGSLRPADNLAVDQALQLAAIEHLATRTAATLSDGELQRALIAKAIAQQTPVILLDEPSAFLDYPGKIHLMQLLAELAHRHGKTIVLSTHDLPLALQYADSLWLMSPSMGFAHTRARTEEALDLINQYFNITL